MLSRKIRVSIGVVLLVTCLGAAANAAFVPGANLLINFGFDSGDLSGWIELTSGNGVRNANPDPMGGDYYLGQTAAINTKIAQDIDLIAIGCDPYRLATGGYEVKLSGWQRSAERIIDNDAGRISLVEYDQYGNQNTDPPLTLGWWWEYTDSWHQHMWDFRLAEGTTKVRYLFETQRNWSAVGNTAAWLDHAHVSLTEYNIWASGGTNLQDGPGLNHVGAGFNDVDCFSEIKTGLERDGGLSIAKDATWNQTGETYVGFNANATGTVDIMGGTLTIKGYTSTSYIGYYGRGIVNITDGGMWSTEGYVRVGAKTGGTGTINIEDGSEWRTKHNTYIGYEAGTTGTVCVTDGNWTSTGVDNYIGYHGDGKVYIGDNGVWNTSQYNSIGKYSNAHIQVDGGTLDSSSCINFYLYPNAYMEIRSQGLWNSNHTIAHGRIDVANSTVNANSFQNWGLINLNRAIWKGGLSACEGTVNIGNNSQFMTSGSVTIGNNTTGADSVINFAHSFWTGNATVYVGDKGNGYLNVSGHSSLVTDGPVYFGNADAAGYLTLDDSDWTARGDVYLGRGGSAYLDILNDSTFTAEKKFKIGRNSTLNIQDGIGIYLNNGIETDYSADLPIEERPTITGLGTIHIGDGYSLDLNNGTQVIGVDYDNRLYIEGNVTGYGLLKYVVVDGSILGDEDGYGILDVKGMRLLENSTLHMKIGGLEAGTEYDQIFFVGHMQVQNATLDIVFSDDFMPELGDSFTLFDFGGHIKEGEFATINLPEFDNDWMEWDIDSLYSTGTITVVPEPATLSLLLAFGAVALICRRFRTK